MKKQNKKNMKKTNRYNGYNAFGQRCEIRTVKLDRENALEQCLEIMNKVEIAQAEGRRLEYTLDWSAMPREEVIQVGIELDRIAKLRRFCVGSYRASL